MRLRSAAPPWFNDDADKQAKCVAFPATKDHDPWYGDSEDLEEEDYASEAKAICKGTFDGKPCPLLESCLEFALVNNERYGVWGGTSPDERVLLRKERKLWQRYPAVGVQSPQDV